MVVLADTDGGPVETLAGRYGIPRSTIYYWLDRLEKQQVADAVQDEPRTGRPPKLSTEQAVEVETGL